MFGRRTVGMSRADAQALNEIAVSMVDIMGTVQGLKAENKCLREDRDTWKALAMKLSGQSDPATARDCP